MSTSPKSIPEIIKNMRNLANMIEERGLPPEYTPREMAHDIRQDADRIEAATKRDKELFAASVARVRELEDLLGGAADCLVGAAIQQKRGEQKTTGNQLRTREALETILKSMAAEHYGEPALSIGEIFKVGKAALSEPPRNCDVGTAKEQVQRYEDWCAENSVDAYDRCQECPLRDCGSGCQLEWAQMPYYGDGGPG